MTVTIADAAAAYRTGLLNAAKAAIDDPDVKVLRGRPGPAQPDDIVSVGVPVGAIASATMSNTVRSRELLMTCPITFSIYRRGGDEQDEVVTERTFDLMSRVETRIRVDDITLGGVVRWCLCTGWTDNDYGVQLLAGGRVLEVIASFDAPVRIKN